MVRAWACLLLLPALARADQEAPNDPILVSSIDGRCYARSQPAAARGDGGTTTVHVVGRRGEADREVARYDWYAPALRLRCAWHGDGADATLVRLGGWPRGRVADDATLALAFYRGGRELARHSTLALAGRADNVRASISHYTVIETVEGFAPAPGGALGFALTRIDGERLWFDVDSGAPLADEAR